ncbi:hypothetical protein GYMLUDRAFT_69329 [Collybiopsis luxurians FD-317 M1]|nr:hypothetical protein GYMLUDRAFT_69329 [Collybiopsis luxurians FD-317 M1]
MLRTSIHKTCNLIQRVLPNSSFSFQSLDSLPFAATVAVSNSSHHLVTALLEQPFSSDSSLNNAIRSRWLNRTHKITIAYGKKVEWIDSTLYIPSSFLSQFPYPVQIVEHSPSDDVPHSFFWENDVPIISCNPVISPLPDLPIENPNAVLVVTAASPSDLVKPPNTLYIDPVRAVQALDAAPNNIQRYQDDFVGSRLPTLSAHIKQSLPSSSSLQDLQTRRVIIQLAHALNTLERTLDFTQRQVDDAVSAASSVHQEFEETSHRVRSQILGIYDPSVKQATESHVSKALAASARQMHAHMARLTWWKMISHVDEINVVVNRVVEGTWCKDLEQQLIFQTGRLTSLQSHFTASTFRALAHSDVIHSPVLQNTLHQLVASPSYTLTPSSLIHPLHNRKYQISQYPTTQLHVVAQRATIGMGASVATGVGIGWAGWLGWLTGPTEGLLGLVAADATTYLGVGILTAVAGIRWGVGKWERAKKNWWADWKRIGDGLERDLSTTLDHTLRNQVGIIPRRAYEGLSELAAKRKDEIIELREELEGIRKDVNKTKVE